MSRTKSRTGEHGDRDLGNHRHIDCDAIALRDTEGLEGIRCLLHLAQQIAICHGASVAWFSDPVEGHLLTTPSSYVAIDAVLGNVQLTIFKPLREGKVPLERLGKWRSPGKQFACLLGPKRHGVCRSPLVEVGLGVRPGSRRRIWCKGATLRLEGLNSLLLGQVAH